MTKLQALFVLYLRHEKLCGGSWRWVSSKYYNRYQYNLPFNPEMSFGGNQVDGIEIEKEAFKTLRGDEMLFMEPYDLYECDLTLLDCNLKNHYD